MRPIYLYLALAIWAIFGVVIANYAKRYMGIGLEDFYLANRKIGGFLSAMTYSATTYSAFMMIGLVGLVYSTGVGAFGFEMTYLIFTVLLLIIFAPRFWSAGRRFNYLTPPEMLADRYGNKWVGVIATIVFLVMLIPYASVQMMGAGYLFLGLSGGDVPFMTGVLIMAGFSGFAAIWAGMHSVSWTDAFQAIIMMISAVLLLLYIFYVFFGGPVSFFTTIELQNPDLLKMNWSFKMFIGLSLPWAFFALTNPQVSQRMFVSKNVKSLKKMIIYFAIFGLVYTIITTLLGFSAANHIPGLADADEAMPALLGNVPTLLALIIFISIFAAASSTLGSIVLTLSSMTTRDIATAFNKELSERAQLIIGKTTIIVIIVVCIFFASLRLNLIAILSAMASGGLLVTAPSLIGTFFWKNGTAEGAIVSMAVGGTLTGAMYVGNYYPLGWWPSIWGFVITILLFVGVSYFTETPEKTDKFLNEVDKEMEKHGF
ncbi:MAG: sodium:solute symporter family protein [Thermoplasmatota archaeon]